LAGTGRLLAKSKHQIGFRRDRHEAGLSFSAAERRRSVRLYPVADNATLQGELLVQKMNLDRQLCEDEAIAQAHHCCCISNSTNQKKELVG
jgi:hypothetical protein